MEQSRVLIWTRSPDIPGDCILFRIKHRPSFEAFMVILQGQLLVFQEGLS